MNIDSEQKVCLSYGLFSFAGGGIGGVLLFAGRVLNDHGGFVSVIEIGIFADKLFGQAIEVIGLDVGQFGKELADAFADGCFFYFGHGIVGYHRANLGNQFGKLCQFFGADAGFGQFGSWHLFGVVEHHSGYVENITWLS